MQVHLFKIIKSYNQAKCEMKQMQLWVHMWDDFTNNEMLKICGLSNWILLLRIHISFTILVPSWCHLQQIQYWHFLPLFLYISSKHTFSHTRSLCIIFLHRLTLVTKASESINYVTSFSLCFHLQQLIHDLIQIEINFLAQIMATIRRLYSKHMHRSFYFTLSKTSLNSWSLSPFFIITN